MELFLTLCDVLKSATLSKQGEKDRVLQMRTALSGSETHAWAIVQIKDTSAAYFTWQLQKMLRENRSRSCKVKSREVAKSLRDWRESPCLVSFETLVYTAKQGE